MKLDILAFGAHPDDVELGCGGTLILHTSRGMKTGVIDLTAGELGTRGTAAIRRREADGAAILLGAAVRENLRFADGLFENDTQHRMEVIRLLRRYRPDFVLANAPDDRHPDHGRAAELVRDAAFLSGLVKIVTKDKGRKQKPWRPRTLLHYIQFRNLRPDIIVDISGCFAKKMKAIRAHTSQFYDPKSKELPTLIASEGFLEHVRARAREMGAQIGVEYGEGFVAERTVGLSDFSGMI